jgi:hypothetical protein
MTKTINKTIAAFAALLLMLSMSLVAAPKASATEIEAAFNLQASTTDSSVTLTFLPQGFFAPGSDTALGFECSYTTTATLTPTDSEFASEVVNKQVEVTTNGMTMERQTSSVPNPITIDGLAPDREYRITMPTAVNCVLTPNGFEKAQYMHNNWSQTPTYESMGLTVIVADESYKYVLTPVTYKNAENQALTFTTAPAAVVPTPDAPDAPAVAVTEDAAKDLAASTNSKVAASTNIKEVKIELDADKFGPLVGQYIHVTGYSDPTDLGTVLVQGTAEAPFVVINASALPKGTHTIAFDLNGALIDAVTLEKLVGATSSAPAISALGLLVVLSLAGVTLAARKRA